MNIYRCPVCGNIIVKLSDSKAALFCCGEQMKLLKANTSDGALEKHVPKVTVIGNDVEVVIGEVVQIKYLYPEQEPKHSFSLKDDKLVAVYEYCNLHGLWKKEM